jgi:hypothetical protein
MKNLFILTCLSFIFFSCEKTVECQSPSSIIETLNYEITNLSSLAEDDASLSELYTIIKTISESETCSEGSSWKFSAYGSKACGGPIGYIAYSKCINTADFLNKIAVFTELQGQYNNKHEVASTCDVPPPPTSVNCEDDKPVLVY